LSSKELPAGRPPTMRDVGALAGVSLKTVSRVINRDPTVSAEIVGRVNRAVDLLGYRPNLAATSLRRADRKTATIGLLLEDVANPFSSALHRAVEDAARERDMLVFAGSSDEDPEREREVLAALVSHQVDGLIVVSSDQGHGDLLLERRRSGLPMVFLDRPAPVPDIDSVTADNRAGACAAVGHLAAHGHRRIAFLGDLHSIWTAAERERGYLDGLAAAGIPVDRALVRRDIRSGEQAREAVLELLAAAGAPTALFTAQNLITVGALRALRQLGAQRRVALMGFDDVQLADLLDPPVSVIAQDPPSLGRTAAGLLLARLDGEESPTRHVVVPTRLVARGSGEIPPPGPGGPGV
jgi:LacI family transcriptional regulator